MLQLRPYHPAQTAPKPSIAAGPPSVRRAAPPSVASSLPAKSRVGQERRAGPGARPSFSHPPGAFVALHARIKGAARQPHAHSENPTCSSSALLTSNCSPLPLHTSIAAIFQPAKIVRRFTLFDLNCFHLPAAEISKIRGRTAGFLWWLEVAACHPQVKVVPLWFACLLVVCLDVSPFILTLPLSPAGLLLVLAAAEMSLCLGKETSSFSRHMGHTSASNCHGRCIIPALPLCRNLLAPASGMHRRPRLATLVSLDSRIAGRKTS
jgi:hypothetical protein